MNSDHKILMQQLINLLKNSNKNQVEIQKFNEIISSLSADKLYININDFGILHHAISHGHHEIVKILLEKGADIEAKTKDGLTPLMFASRNGHHEIVKTLLEKGADIEAKTIDDFPSLILASRYGYHEIVKTLLEKGANIEAKNIDGWNSLMLASQYGYREIVQTLVENKANIEAKNKYNGTSIMLASQNHHVEIVKIFLEKGADIEAKNKNDWLLFASQNGWHKIVKIFLEKGFDIEAKTNIGFTPLIVASQYGRDETVKILLEKGADIKFKSKDGFTPLMLASLYGRHETVKILLEKGVDIEAKNKFGFNSLIYASQDGHNEIVKILLEKGADTKIKSKDGFTPLMLASQNGHNETVKILLEKGVDIEAINKFGFNSLIYASQNGHNEVVKILLEKGADIESKNKDGFTPLICASSKGKAETVKILLEKGAKNEIISLSTNPIFFALQNGDRKTIGVLVADILDKSTSIKDKVIDAKKLSSKFSYFSSNIGIVNYHQLLHEEFIKSIISSSKILDTEKKGNYFPKSLFQIEKTSSNNSPFALFNVLQAINDKEAFQGLTLPSQSPSKMKIIIDVNSFKESGNDQILSLQKQKLIIERLVSNGFNVYLCVSNKSANQKTSSELSIESSEDFKPLNEKNIQQITNLLSREKLAKFVLNEESFKNLSILDPSIASDNILNPNINQLFTVFGLSYIKESIEYSKEDIDLFTEMNREHIKLVEKFLDTKKILSYSNKYLIALFALVSISIIVSIFDALYNSDVSKDENNANSNWIADNKIIETLQSSIPSQSTISDKINYAISALLSASYTDIFSFKKVDAIISSTPKNPQGIYVAKGNPSFEINDQNGIKQTFQMQNTGEILSNNIKKLKTRTALKQFKIESNRLFFYDFNDDKIVFTNFIPKILSDSDIKKLKNSRDNGAYVKFTDNLEANKKQRLFSIDSSEEMIGVLDNIDGLKIEKGDDGFFYATSNTSRELTYILDGRDNFALKNIEEFLPDNNPIQKIINDYRDQKKGFVTSIKSDFQVPLNNGDVNSWLNQIYEKRAGACIHRVASVYHKITTEFPDQQDNVRIVGIDNNHVILEARENKDGKWIQFDLGGAEAELVYEQKKSIDQIKTLSQSLNQFLFKGEGLAGYEMPNIPPQFYPILAFIVLTSNIIYQQISQGRSRKDAIHKKNDDIHEDADENLSESSEIIKELEYKKDSGLSSLSKSVFVSASPPSNSPLILDIVAITKAFNKQLKDKITIEQINSDDFFAKVTSQNLTHKKTLIISNKTLEIANYAFHEVINSGIAEENIFYLDDPSQIFNQKHLNIDSSGKASIFPYSQFKSFIDFNKKSKNCVLVINWSSFSNKEVVALNALLDSNSIFDGVKINNPTIISICSQTPNDKSFLSRHNAILKLEEDINLEFAIKSKIDSNKTYLDFGTAISESFRGNSDKTYIVDLEGALDWKQKLFGSVTIDKDEILFKKSEFYDAISNGYKSFKIINISKEAQKELEQELKIAKSKGVYNYFGYKIPANFEISFVESDLNFLEFFKAESTTQLRADRNFKVNHIANAKSDNIADDYLVVNSFSFDFLLKQKEIINGDYFETQGAIAQKKDQTLNLFITAQLTDQQYYLLFSESSKNNVALNLYLAQGVIFPSTIKSDLISQNSNSSKDVITKHYSSNPKIIISNDPIKSLQNLTSQKSDLYAVIDVEDYDYFKLFTETKFKSDQDGFKDFQEVESEFLQQIRQGKKIVLKGEFSQGFLSILHPIIIGEKYPEIKDNLILIIEDKDIKKTSKKCSYLLFLDEKNYKIDYHESPSISTPNKTGFEFFESSNIDSDLDFEFSETKSLEFIQKRKESLIKTLKEKSLVQIVGHSGVGKSQLIKRLADIKIGIAVTGEIKDDEAKDKFAVYNEMTSFEDWANDKSDKIKILFIDESNIEDSHLTKFSPLKIFNQERSSETVLILHDKKFFEISKNHKVVFARNPENYSIARKSQKLFDEDVATLYLRDFSKSYIYEEILKKPIYDELSHDIKSKIPEIAFKKICKEYIANYQKFNQQKRDNHDDINCKTVRELQEEALNFIYEKIEIYATKKTSTISEIEAENPNKIISENFTSTNATKEIEVALRKSLKIRGYQRDKILGSVSAGLNGFIIKGDAGVGKSELIRAVFEAENIIAGNLDLDSPANIKSDLRKFYKIDANTSKEKMLKLITKAFEEGNIIWIDEINSCIDKNGLEKNLNLALTGMHPEGKSQQPINPGFMLVSSINPAFLPGRSQISPALNHRSIICESKSLNQYQLEDLEVICKHKLELQYRNMEVLSRRDYDMNSIEIIAKSIAKDFKNETSIIGNNLSLRDLDGAIKNIDLNIRTKSTGSSMIEKKLSH